MNKPVHPNELAKTLAAIFGMKPAPTVADPAEILALPSPQPAHRLLLVEDNSVNQEVCLAILERLGYTRVDVAFDGREALLRLAETTYDLVLMDCQLPELDGYEATRLIRDPTTPVRNHNVPIVAMTAHAMNSDRDKCLAAGMNDYVAKPIEPSILAQTIAKWLAPQTVPDFDFDSLLDRLMNNRAAATRVLTRFIDDMPQQLQRLAQALERADHEAIRLTSHSIKGAAANVGGEQVRQVALRMEKLGAAGDAGGAAGLFQELSAVSASLCAEMRRHLA